MNAWILQKETLPKISKKDKLVANAIFENKRFYLITGIQKEKLINFISSICRIQVVISFISFKLLQNAETDLVETVNVFLTFGLDIFEDLDFIFGINVTKGLCNNMTKFKDSDNILYC